MSRSGSGFQARQILVRLNLISHEHDQAGANEIPKYMAMILAEVGDLGPGHSATLGQYLRLFTSPSGDSLVVVDWNLYNTLLQAFAAAGEIKQLTFWYDVYKHHIFNDNPQRHLLPPSSATYASMIRAYIENSETFDVALQLLDDMVFYHVHPSPEIFDALLSRYPTLALPQRVYDLLLSRFFLLLDAPPLPGSLFSAFNDSAALVKVIDHANETSFAPFVVAIARVQRRAILRSQLDQPSLPLPWSPDVTCALVCALFRLDSNTAAFDLMDLLCRASFEFDNIFERICDSLSNFQLMSCWQKLLDHGIKPPRALCLARIQCLPSSLEGELERHLFFKTLLLLEHSHKFHFHVDIFEELTKIAIASGDNELSEQLRMISVDRGHIGKKLTGS